MFGQSSNSNGNGGPLYLDRNEPLQRSPRQMPRTNPWDLPAKTNRGNTMMDQPDGTMALIHMTISMTPWTKTPTGAERPATSARRRTRRSLQRPSTNRCWSTMRLSPLFVVLILLCLITDRCNANQRQLGDNNQNNNDDGEINGELHVYSTCTGVTVQSMYLTCDSPGAYYYGSGSYRNSDRCKYGDKAKLIMYCKSGLPHRLFLFVSVCFYISVSVSVSVYWVNVCWFQSGTSLSGRSTSGSTLTSMSTPTATLTP